MPRVGSRPEHRWVRLMAVWRWADIIIIKRALVLQLLAGVEHLDIDVVLQTLSLPDALLKTLYRIMPSHSQSQMREVSWIVVSDVANVEKKLL